MKTFDVLSEIETKVELYCAISKKSKQELLRLTDEETISLKSFNR